MSPDDIKKIAQQCKAAGIPDLLNRWLVMTPEQLAESDQRISGQREAFRKRRTTMKTVGPKEAQLRASRADHTEPKASAAAEPTKESAMSKSTVSKKTKTEAKPAKAKKENKVKTAKTAAADGIRPGTKLALVVDLLKRPEGCTTKDVLNATGWPAVSMPQQAKAAGIKLKKEKKEGDVTRYYAAA